MLLFFNKNIKQQNCTLLRYLFQKHEKMSALHILTFRNLNKPQSLSTEIWPLIHPAVLVLQIWITQILWFVEYVCHFIFVCFALFLVFFLFFFWLCFYLPSLCVSCCLLFTMFGCLLSSALPALSASAKDSGCLGGKWQNPVRAYHLFPVIDLYSLSL